jgi:hypothetical protein
MATRWARYAHLLHRRGGQLARSPKFGGQLGLQQEGLGCTDVTGLGGAAPVREPGEVYLRINQFERGTAPGWCICISAARACKLKVSYR